MINSSVTKDGQPWSFRWKWQQFSDAELRYIFNRLCSELCVNWVPEKTRTRQQIEDCINYMTVEKGKRAAARQDQNS